MFFEVIRLNNELIIPSVENTSIKIYDSQTSAQKEYRCDWHFHNEYEILFLYEGTKFFYSKNQTFELKKGDMVFVNSRIPHKTLTPKGSRGMLIQFNDEFSYEYQSTLALLKNKESEIIIFPAGSTVNTKIWECLKKISSEYSVKDEFYNMYIKSYVYEILAHLYRYEILSAPDKLMNKKHVSVILPALNYISEHYSEQITLDEISNLIYTEKSYFCKLFKRATKTSFLNYLNFIRICHAEFLLRETRKSVEEIAIETGFSSSSYFAETFKKINLLSPTAYRKRVSSDNL